MTNKLLLILMIFTLGFFSCGKKKEEPKKQVKREVVKPIVVVKDTIPPAPEPIIIEKPDNKYFLIAASFERESNAISFKNSLIEKGLDSEVIVRSTGRNKEFYKVSYKGFVDKKEAYQELSMEKNQPEHQDVWLLVKK